MEERRRHVRAAQGLPCHCFRVEPSGALGPAFPAVIVEISAGGARIVTSEGLGFSNRISVEFAIDGVEIETRAEVRHRATGDRNLAYGIAFVGLGAAEQAAISRFVVEDARRWRERAAAHAQGSPPAAA